MPVSQPRLQWTERPESPNVFPLSAEVTIIGRRSDAGLVLSHPQVSRQHARIVREDGSFTIIDLGSTHGTFVNGKKIQRHQLEPGDRIRLGQHGLDLTYLAAGPAHDDLSTASDLWVGGLEESLRRLAAVIPRKSSPLSDLEKINYVLDFQYSFGKDFSPGKTFVQILKSALEISGSERGFILRKRHDTFDYTVGLDDAGSLLPQSDFRASRGVVSQVEEQARAVFMTRGIAGDLAGRESIVAMNLRAIACLPLEAMSQRTGTAALLGILYLDSRKNMHSLTGLDHRSLTKLAEEAGHVLEKLELIEALEERTRIDQDLALAQETQRSLLPRTLPVFDPFRVHAFCRPTRHVGGDFYDFLLLDSGELVGVVADVSGKGISAALLGSLMQGALSMEFRSTAQPEQVLGRVNEFLCQRTPPNRFVTAFVFLLNRSGEGEFLSAGHNPAYLFRGPPGGSKNSVRAACRWVRLNPRHIGARRSRSIPEIFS